MSWYSRSLWLGLVAVIAIGAYVVAARHEPPPSPERQVLALDTIASLRARTVQGLPNGTQALVGGYTRLGDGGGGIFVLSSDNKSEPDGGTVFAAEDRHGRWLRLSGGVMNVRFFGAKGDGVKDDTIAIQTAINSAGAGKLRGRVIIPAGAYVVSSSLKLGPGAAAIPTPLVIQGDGQATQLINAAPPGNPTFAILGASYFEIRDLLLSGDSKHKNDGVLVGSSTAKIRSARFVLDGVTSMMPGCGFVIRDANTGVLRNCRHWPSANSLSLTVPQKVEAMDIHHGIYLTGDQDDDISIYDFESGLTPSYTPGTAAICADALHTFGLRISAGTIEGTGSPPAASLRLKNTNWFSVLGSFAENSDFIFDNCRYGLLASIDKSGSIGTTRFTGSSAHITYQDSLDLGISIEAGCSGIELRNLNLNTDDLVDHGTASNFTLVRTPHGLQPNKP